MFETDVLAKEQNYQGLARLNTDLVQHEAARPRTRRLILEIDSSESPVHGADEQSVDNGHVESVCYHPLFVFNQDGDGRATFALPALYKARERRDVAYAIRLPANQVLERTIEDLFARPRGRPSHAPLFRYRSVQYQAASWGRPRRVIAKVEHHLGELFRVGFIVTTLAGTNRAVIHFYNPRGTAEQGIKEGKEVTHWTRFFCHRRRANEVRLLLGLITYNLGNLLRRLVPQGAESHLTSRLFGQILVPTKRLAWHPI